MPARYPRSLSVAGLVTAILLNSAVAKSAPKDSEALELAKKAINTDYLGMKFADAEKRLKQALKLCDTPAACSDKVRAQLHGDLGAVYFGGMSRPDDAKAQFAAALKADPSVTLNSDLVSPEMEAAFAEAKSGAGATGAAPEAPAPGGSPEEGAPKAPEAKPVKAPESEATAPAPSSGTSECPPDAPPDFPGCKPKTEEDVPCAPDATDCVPVGKAKGRKNWLVLAVQQDFLAFSSGKEACSQIEGQSDPAITCFDAGAPIQRRPYAGTGTESVGNEIKGGFAMGTTRVLLGYDRAIGPVTLGTRLGIAFPGGPTGFLALHAEGRLAYWFGKNPFARKGLRPYVVVGGGIGQVDSKIAVKVFRDQSAYASNTTTSFDAWKQAGTGFISGGIGTMIAVTPRHGPLVELKVMELLPQASTGLSLQLGYAVGF